MPRTLFTSKGLQRLQGLGSRRCSRTGSGRRWSNISTRYAANTAPIGALPAHPNPAAHRMHPLANFSLTCSSLSPDLRSWRRTSSSAWRLQGWPATTSIALSARCAFALERICMRSGRPDCSAHFGPCPAQPALAVLLIGRSVLPCPPLRGRSAPPLGSPLSAPLGPSHSLASNAGHPRQRH